MQLLLTRRPSTDHCTLGLLFVDGRFECFACEDIVRVGPKIPGQTAIPAGTYAVDITPSQRFGRMLPELKDVPGFSGIRLHPGNTAADTSGCILVGQRSTVDSVVDSRLAMAALQPKIASALARGEDVSITIVNPPSEEKRLA